MKINKIFTVFIGLSLLANISATSQNVQNVGFNLGGGPVFHTVRYPQLQSPGYSMGGNLQLNFMKKRNFSFGLEAGGQLVIEKFQVTYLRWNASETQFPYNPYQPYSLAPTEFTSKKFLWQLLLNSKYQFRNNTFLEGSLGVLFDFYENNSQYGSYTAPMVGLGGGYLFKLSNTISIPLKFKTYYTFKPRISDRSLQVSSGPLFMGIYSGIAFNVDK